MSLEDMANVVLSTEAPAISQVGFGTLALAAYHTHNTDLSRTYTSLGDMVLDGFTTWEHAYKMAARAFAQKPNRPVSVKVLRLATPWTQVVKWTPVAAVNSTIYGYTVEYKGVSYDVTYTSDSSATVAEIVTGLASAFEALASAISSHATAAASDGTTRSAVTADIAGDVFYVRNWTDNLSFEDVTPDPGVQADLAAIRNVDADWYGLVIGLNANAILQQVDAYVETIVAMLGCNTSDSKAFDSVATTDVGFVLKGLSAGRVIGGFCLKDTSDYTGVAMLAQRFPFDPGAQGAGGTFAFKGLVGVPVSNLTATQKTNLRAKNYVVYETTAGVNHTLDGKVFGGEFADVVRLLDWYRIRSEEGIVQTLLNNDKVPFDDHGISQIYSALSAVQLQGEANGGFVKGASILTVPARSAVPSADRAARKLTGIAGSVTLAGAVHLVSPISISVGT
jgi:hypothetical protein